MARLGIDAHAIGERLTGNETYITNLIDSLAGLNLDHELVLFFTHEATKEEWAAKYPELESVLVRPVQPFVRIPLVMPWLARQLELDLLHVQYVGPPIMAAPLVAVIHDISFESHPEYFARLEVIQFRATIRLTAHRARKILTISEHSKRDLMEIYGVPEEKVVVTYLGVSARFQPVHSEGAKMETRRKYGISRDYLLAVGNLQPRKNLVRLIEAFTRLKNARPDIDHQLVIVGKKAFKHDPILDFARSSRWSDDIIFSGYVPDEDLPALYAGASVMVYPSLYEGFGLPPLEAMACGTPVIVSDRASLPEVVGDAGLKVDPFDIDGMAANMAAMILDEQTANWFRDRGLERSKRFTWDKTARMTAGVYEQVLREERTG